MNARSRLHLWVQLRLLIVLVFFAMPSAASPTDAPQESAPTSPFAQIAGELERETPAAPLPPQFMLKDHEDHAAHLRWQREFSRQSWEWHLHSTKLLMYVVLAIVFFGLFVTYLQFTYDRRPRKSVQKNGAADTKLEAPPTSQELTDGTPVTSTLKLGPAGLEITSQVIGLLALGFSLAFFYFYVKDVYPMQDLELKQQATSVPAPAVETAKKN